MANKSNRPKKKVPSKGVKIPKLKKYDAKTAWKDKHRGKTWKHH